MLEKKIDKITYKKLIEIGFEKVDIEESINFERLGFNDFYLKYKINEKTQLEWNWNEPYFVKLVFYNGEKINEEQLIFDLILVKETITAFYSK